MPTYEYRCTVCGNHFEIVQKFSDRALDVCPECGAELHKVFNSVGVVFKGTGFYSTDNKQAKQKKKKPVVDKPSSQEDSSQTTAKPEPVTT